MTVGRFAPGGGVSADLQLTGYSTPTIAADGENVRLVMIRAGDGFLVSRSYSATEGWSQQYRVEVGADGGGNALRDADGRLRLIVRGPSGASKRAAMLAFQRPLQ